MMEDGFLKDMLEGRKYQTDLLLTVFISFIGVAVALILPDGNFFRIIFGIPLLLFIPGYCIVSVLWPEKYVEGNENAKGNGIDLLERIALSCGLSIATVSTMAFTLNYTPSGITLVSALVGLLSIVIVLSAIAYYRRIKIPSEKRFSINLTLVQERPAFAEMNRFLTVGIGVALVVSGISLGYLLFTPMEGEKYTEFYVQDTNRTTNNYPFNLTVNESGSVIIGIVCHEARRVNYSIVAGIESANVSQYVDNWNGPFHLTNNSMIGRNITLSNEDTFEDTFSFYIGETGSHKIVWQLYIDGVKSIYEVHLWVNLHVTK